MPGSRVGFLWVYCIIVFFAIGIIELIILPAVTFQLVPALQLSANNTLSAANALEYGVRVNTTIGYMHLAMYVVMFVVFIYGVVSIFKREENEMYQP